MAAVAVNVAPASAAQPSSLHGTHADGATYAIEVPANWNGTLLTFSPGYGAGAGPAARGGELGQAGGDQLSGRDDLHVAELPDVVVPPVE